MFELVHDDNAAESRAQMNFTDFGMDTASLAGSLEAKLAAIRRAGFSQVMISAVDVVAHPQGTAAAVDAIRRSGLRVTGYQALRDFEGLTGHLHAYKIDVAKVDARSVQRARRALASGRSLDVDAR